MKFYVREGRAFKQFPNLTNKFLQCSGEFSTTRNKYSIGICVRQEITHLKILLFEEIEGTWTECLKACEEIGGHMPTREEMLSVMRFAKYGIIPQHHYWTKDEYDSRYAWSLDLRLDGSFGYCYASAKYNYYSVIAFANIPMEHLSYVGDSVYSGFKIDGAANILLEKY